MNQLLISDLKTVQTKLNDECNFKWNYDLTINCNKHRDALEKFDTHRHMHMYMYMYMCMYGKLM